MFHVRLQYAIYEYSVLGMINAKQLKRMNYEKEKKLNNGDPGGSPRRTSKNGLNV